MALGWRGQSFCDDSIKVLSRLKSVITTGIGKNSPFYKYERFLQSFSKRPSFSWWIGKESLSEFPEINGKQKLFKIRWRHFGLFQRKNGLLFNNFNNSITFISKQTTHSDDWNVSIGWDDSSMGGADGSEDESSGRAAAEGGAEGVALESPVKSDPSFAASCSCCVW